MAKSQKKPQSQKFIDKARELGVDEDKKTFEATPKRIAASPPLEKTSKKKNASSK